MMTAHLPNDPKGTPISFSRSTARRENLHRGSLGVPFMNSMTGEAVIKRVRRARRPSSCFSACPPAPASALRRRSTREDSSAASAPSSLSTSALDCRAEREQMRG